MPDNSPENTEGKATGDGKDFSVDSVTWGYREIFSQAIDELRGEGLLGAEHRKVTEKFFGMLQSADQSCFDHVLKEFLCSLNPDTRWIMTLPGIFSDVVDTGRSMAEAKLHYGIGFFRILGEGGFGDTPARVRKLLSVVRRLRGVDDDLAFSFIKGYSSLSGRLSPEEIDLYVNQGLDIFSRNPKAGYRFMECAVKSSENIIRSLTSEARLEDETARLESVIHALTGTEMEVGCLGDLDADFLVERGTNMVCMYRWLYLPHRVRNFETAEENRSWYMLCAIVAAGMLTENGFSSVHGHPRYSTVADIVGGEVLRQNLFMVMDYVRVLKGIIRRWPGARRLVRFGAEMERKQVPPVSAADKLFFDAAYAACLGGDAEGSLKKLLRSLDGCSTFFDEADSLAEPWVAGISKDYPGLAHSLLRTFAFLPDFLYPGEVSAPPSDAMLADLKQDSQKSSEDKTEGGGDNVSVPDGESAGDSSQEGEDKKSIPACYVYDEWSHAENDYYRDFCYVHELRSDEDSHRFPSMDGLSNEVHRVRQVFERLRPELVHKEKYLDEGDVINPDLLMEYLVQKRLEPSPQVKFYEKPMVNRRDLAVVVLLDVSGSTGDDAGREKIIDVEKKAALLMGEGLALLGDRFSVCGFSTNGRENCTYHLYKDFGDRWDAKARSRIFSARPANATRIGAALRHSGYRLDHIEARQKLIILVTDGRPMDSGYDPNTRYAQYDVRKACEENGAKMIHTLGISTQENSLADMEIMFPKRRFVILEDIRSLPKVLPRLYIKLTV